MTEAVCEIIFSRQLLWQSKIIGVVCPRVAFFISRIHCWQGWCSKGAGSQEGMRRGGQKWGRGRWGRGERERWAVRETGHVDLVHAPRLHAKRRERWAWWGPWASWPLRYPVTMALAQGPLAAWSMMLVLNDKYFSTSGSSTQTKCVICYVTNTQWCLPTRKENQTLLGPLRHCMLISNMTARRDCQGSSHLTPYFRIFTISWHSSILCLFILTF